MNRYHVFETAHGFAAIGWSGKGVTAFRLPASNAAEAERALLRRLPDAVRTDPPADVAAVINAAQRYFAGEQIDFGAIFKELSDNRFPGWVVVEQSRSDDSPLASAKANAEFVKDLGYSLELAGSK